MSVYDVQKIINGTPEKVLRNQYAIMTENYNEKSAEVYKEAYVNKPVSFLIENAEYILSEPYYGLSYFERVLDPSNCAFFLFDTLKESVDIYMEKMKESNAPSKQIDLYSDLYEKVNSIYNNAYYTRVYSAYIERFISEDFNRKLCDALSTYESSEEKDPTEVISLFKENKNPIIYATYIPYVTEKVGITELTTDLNDTLVEVLEGVDPSTRVDAAITFMDTAICVHSLFQDDIYKEAVNSLQNREYKNTIYYLAQDNLLESKIDTSVLHEEAPVVTTDGELAVNLLFNDVYESAYGVDEVKEDLLMGLYYESIMKVVSTNYQMADDLKKVVNYPMLESSSVEDSFKYLEENAVFEKSEDDTDDDENGDPNESQDDLVDTHYGSIETGKKLRAPKPKNLANRIQNSAMDAEARQYKRRAERKAKGLEAKNAAKAVGQLPKHVIDDMKKTIHTLDEMDDRRRKNYMSTPGFRKKIFRNIKVAILYGAAASIKLALVPVIMVLRHFSKQKDKRIRNELIRELDTDIKVTEEKINDAQAEGDRQKKYRLMRLRDKLEAERTRVLFNSKVV